MTLSRVSFLRLRPRPGHGRRRDPRDPGVLQILAVEHSGLLSARSLVYNESFARVASFLALVSMSFVGLALLAQAWVTWAGLLAREPPCRARSPSWSRPPL